MLSIAKLRLHHAPMFPLRKPRSTRGSCSAMRQPLSYRISCVMTRKRLLCFFALFLFPAASVQAHAWGCEGHQIVALLAMRHLQPQIANQVNAILAASPVPLSLRHFCRTSGLPLIAEVASWADDIRSEQPETGPLHFVDIPLTARREKYEINQACQQG